jgi:hypothetical protein
MEQLKWIAAAVVAMALGVSPARASQQADRGPPASDGGMVVLSDAELDQVTAGVVLLRRPGPVVVNVFNIALALNLQIAVLSHVTQVANVQALIASPIKVNARR